MQFKQTTSNTVSIIVPVYNVSKYLNQCIKSILNQSYHNIELILVDDGSTDDSAAICDQYAKIDCRVSVIHKSNGGLTSARNAGLETATGEWIMHVDSDDYICDDMVKDMIVKANETGADIILGGMRFFWENSTNTFDIMPIEWSSDKITSLNHYIRSNWTCLCGTMAKRQLYSKNGLKSPEGITWHEDFYLMIRLIFFSNCISTINKPYYCYRQHSSSIMNHWSEGMEESARYVLESTEDFLKKHTDYTNFKKSMGWRLLNVHQNIMLSPSKYTIVEKIAKEYRLYILQCPYLTYKHKILYILHSFKIIRILGIKRTFKKS